MARIHTATFRVHHYDLDAFGELRASAYVRFLQQAATEASEAAGFSDAWYARAGTSWLVRRTSIDYRRPVHAALPLHIRTWVADVRRVRSQREYEVYLDEDDGPVARAHTDWVYVERGTARPRRVPQEIIDGLLPDGMEPSLPRPPWAGDGPPARAFVTTRVVEFRDLDGLAHVNNASYLDYVEESALAASADAGWPLDRVIALGGCWRPQSHDIEYLAESLYGDQLRCISWVTACNGAGLERQTEIRRAEGEALLVRARSRWRWVAAATRSPALIPAPLAAALVSGCATTSPPHEPTP
jgi:acyl-CoA thioester hydrolase